MSEPSSAATVARWIVVFDYRAGQGLLRVGPFSSPVEAHTWASLDTAGGDASWEVWEIEPPTQGADHA